MTSEATKALDDIAAERRRQIEVEGWTPEHDDHHRRHELSRAAACYADPDPLYSGDPRISVPARWPWAAEWWKPSRSAPANRANYFKDRRRDLVRAGALIVAEIERLDREASQP